MLFVSKVHGFGSADEISCCRVRDIYLAYSPDGVVKAVDNALFPIECWDYKLPIFTKLMVTDRNGNKYRKADK